MKRKGIKNVVVAVFVTATTMIFASCGEKATAKSTVKSFLKENLEGKDLSIVDCADLDSTQRISDSLVLKLREMNFPKAKYVAMPKSTKLRYIRVKYATDRDTTTQTFYMNQDLSGVIAVK